MTTTHHLTQRETTGLLIRLERADKQLHTPETEATLGEELWLKSVTFD